MWPFHFILAIGMGLMCVVSFLQFIEDIHSYIKGDHFTDEVEDKYENNEDDEDEDDEIDENVNDDDGYLVMKVIL